MKGHCRLQEGMVLTDDEKSQMQQKHVLTEMFDLSAQHGERKEEEEKEREEGV